MSLIRIQTFLCAVVLCWAAASNTVRAEEGERAKSLDFEDSLVEGLNKRPLDSLAQIAQDKDDDNTHLYPKKVHFHAENQETLRELRLTQ